MKSNGEINTKARLVVPLGDKREVECHGEECLGLQVSKDALVLQLRYGKEFNIDFTFQVLVVIRLLFSC